MCVEFISKELMGQKSLPKTFRPAEENFANDTAYLLAYTLGRISLKKSIKKVITIICIPNPKLGLLKLKILFDKKVDKTTMPTFTKLLVTNIVASSLSGCSRKLRTRLHDRELISRIFSISPGKREKKATSLPDTSAETKRSKTMVNTPKNTLKSIFSGRRIDKIKKQL